VERFEEKGSEEMKYECVKCKKLFDENEIVMTETTDLSGRAMEPYCEECYKKKGEKKRW